MPILGAKTGWQPLFVLKRILVGKWSNNRRHQQIFVFEWRLFSRFCQPYPTLLQIVSTVPKTILNIVNIESTFVHLFITFTFQHTLEKSHFLAFVIVNIWSPTSVYAQFGNPRTFSDIFFLGPRGPLGLPSIGVCVGPSARISPFSPSPPLW